MDWPLGVLIAGVCVSVAVLLFGLLCLMPRARMAVRGSADERRYNGLRELCLAVNASGLVLISVSVIANDVRFAAAPVSPAIFLAPGAFFIWQFGFWLGRASLRLRQPATGIANS